MRQMIIMALAATLSTAGIAAGPIVSVQSGPIEGRIARGVETFAGIPYAAPPIGPLRWRAPHPPASWSGIRRAEDFGADCMQAPFPGDAAPSRVPFAEDCLFANVWRPAAAGARRLPVMVWIHGGGFVNGGSSPAVYSGAEMAKKGLVFVSFNYRLGRFGFFAHPGLSRAAADGGQIGNYGYMDQIAALRWVHRNIAAFGGDAANVTLVGESAGGGSVLALLASGLVKGFVHKAIVQSGGGRGFLMGERSLAGGPSSAEQIGVNFARRWDIEGKDAEALVRLRALSADQLVDGLQSATISVPNPPTYAGPMTDGRIVREAPDAAIRDGSFTFVPMIIGTTGLDVGFTPAADAAAAYASFDDKAGKAEAAYDPDGKADPKWIPYRVAGDFSMVEPARYVARLIAKAGGRSYVYRFEYVATSLAAAGAAGAFHSSDIPFALDTVRARYGNLLSKLDRNVAEKMSDRWARFAKNEDLVGDSTELWPAFSSHADTILDIGASGDFLTVPDRWRLREDLTEARSHADIR